MTPEEIRVTDTRARRAKLKPVMEKEARWTRAWSEFAQGLAIVAAVGALAWVVRRIKSRVLD